MLNLTAPLDPDYLFAITLTTGSHPTRAAGVCAMEAVAWLAGEPHTHAPTCVDSDIVDFVIAINDGWSDANRQRLIPYLPRLLGTARGNDHPAREQWNYLLLDWHARVSVPARLDQKGKHEMAAAMRSLHPLTSYEAWQDARKLCPGDYINPYRARMAAGRASTDEEVDVVLALLGHMIDALKVTGGAA